MRAVILATLSLGVLGASDLEVNAKNILSKRCLGCHNASAKVAGLNLSDRESALKGGVSGSALAPGSAEQSKLLARVEAKQMPPGNPLPAEEIAALRQWIEGGAAWEGALNPPRQRAGPDWWSLQPLKKVDPPGVSAEAGEWRMSPIDRFLYARLRENGLRPSPPAERETFIRRATLDLLGLPPTPQEIDAFAADKGADAYEKLIDRLLASPHYGERWGRHWLDVVRFGESFGYERNLPRERAWPYRDYVVRSFNQDKPFSRMILDQLAADQIAPGDQEIEAATGFLVAGIHDDVTSAVPEDILARRSNDLDDIVTTVGAAFLGLSVNCARCHDHKFDPIEQKDYYRILSVFDGVEHGERNWAPAEVRSAFAIKAEPIEKELRQTREQLQQLRTRSLPQAQRERGSIEAGLLPPVRSMGTEESFPPADARFVRMKITRSASSTKTPGGKWVLAVKGSPSLDEVELWTHSTPSRNVAAGAKVHANAGNRAPDALVDGKFNARWTSKQSQFAEVTIELASPSRISRIVWSNDRPGEMQGVFQGGVPLDYVFEGSLDGSNWSELFKSVKRLPLLEEDREELALLTVMPPADRTRWRDLKSTEKDLEKRLASIPPVPTAYIGAFSQPAEAAWLAKGGNPMNRGDVIAPAPPAVLSRMLPAFELDPNAPEAQRRLTLARWLSDNRNALVARVLANRVWHYHFGTGLVGTPNDFGLNGEKPSHPELLEWLSSQFIANGWRIKPLHREIMLSQAYRQSSRLDEDAARKDRGARLLWRFPPRRLEAEAIRDAILAVSGALDKTMGGPGFLLFDVRVNNVAAYTRKETFGPETFRRAVYSKSIRSITDSMMGSFDCPDSTTSVARRQSSTTPLQTLEILNNPFMLDQAKRFAERIERATPGDGIAAQVETAFRLAFGRRPADWEIEQSSDFIKTHGLAALCRVLLAASEFVYVM